VKLLLTSAGIKNTSIHDALTGLLGKPIAESSALCIPTASYGHPMGGPAAAWRFIAGRASTPLCELGWQSLGVLELTALPSIGEELWVPLVQETDALLAGGGDSLYLCHLDAAVRTGRPPGVAARGLGGSERREHGDGPQHR
jgi:dipeptidase E